MSVGDLVLPCLDEAEALPWVLSHVPVGWRPIVVDNGSTDGSADVARAHGALVVHEPRRGFGAAGHAGVTAATAELVAVCDADASLDPGALTRLAAPVLAGDAELVLGRRRPVGRTAWPLHARVANRVLAARIRAATGTSVHDLGPMRVARRAALVGLGLRDRRSGYPLEMLLAAARAGWRITELDVDYRPRVGRSKVTGTVRGTVTAVIDMQRLLGRHSAHPSDRGSGPNDET
ncbi:MAG TPA: glycosyltransferase family 2 protein [Amnibacterium sp.]|nr:glycosyltransferase family 2 protein [Amnibacterium sp.]